MGECLACRAEQAMTGRPACYLHAEVRSTDTTNETKETK